MDNPAPSAHAVGGMPPGVPRTAPASESAGVDAGACSPERELRRTGPSGPEAAPRCLNSPGAAHRARTAGPGSFVSRPAGVAVPREPGPIRGHAHSGARVRTRVLRWQAGGPGPRRGGGEQEGATSVPCSPSAIRCADASFPCSWVTQHGRHHTVFPPLPPPRPRSNNSNFSQYQRPLYCGS